MILLMDIAELTKSIAADGFREETIAGLHVACN